MNVKKTFTLIELIVVIAIIAILSAIITPNAFRAIQKAKISGTISNMKSVRAAAFNYYADIGTWPWQGATQDQHNNTGIGLVSDDGALYWDGPYLESWPRAEWSGNRMDFYYVHYLVDWDRNGIAESHFISLRKFGGSTNDSLALPRSVMQRIDDVLDNGDLNTGALQLYGGRYFDWCLVY